MADLEVISTRVLVALVVLGGVMGTAGAIANGAAASDHVVTRSAGSGNWSDPKTWEGNDVPSPGAVVLVRPGHTVRFDVKLDRPIRALYIGGILSVAKDRDTILSAGFIRIQDGEETSEDDFDGSMKHGSDDLPTTAAKATLEVGTSDEPIPAGVRALIQLAYIDGMDRDHFPALVCRAGRLELHGAPMDRTWVNLGSTADAGDTVAQLAQVPTGWRPGDRLIFTATDAPPLFGQGDQDEKILYKTSRDGTHTEESVLKRVIPPVEEGDSRLQVEKPLAFHHEANEGFAGVVANLSRNVVIESAEPGGVRGHTMVQKNSFGSISYTEFRHLGKKGVLGRYNLHFHMVGDTMRGSSLVGASFWDSQNRWLTVHATNRLVVRDCVGYRSIGHGFFLEDGTEVDNLFDRNLAVQALGGSRLCAARSFPSITTTARVSGGPTAGTPSPGTWRSSATSTAIASR